MVWVYLPVSGSSILRTISEIVPPLTSFPEPCVRRIRYLFRLSWARPGKHGENKRQWRHPVEQRHQSRGKARVLVCAGRQTDTRMEEVVLGKLPYTIECRAPSTFHVDTTRECGNYQRFTLPRTQRWRALSSASTCGRHSDDAQFRRRQRHADLTSRAYCRAFSKNKQTGRYDIDWTRQSWQKPEGSDRGARS